MFIYVVNATYLKSRRENMEVYTYYKLNYIGCVAMKFTRIIDIDNNKYSIAIAKEICNDVISCMTHQE